MGNRVEEELLKLEKEETGKYELPKDFNEWSQRDREVLLAIIVLLKESERDYKKEFLKIHRRRVAIVSTVLFVGLSFINPFLGLGAASVIVIAGYWFDRFIEKMEV